MSEENEPSGIPRGSVSGTFRLIDLFDRNHPAFLEGKPEAWGFAMTVIDHGSFFCRQLDSFRSESGLRDPVIQALFRRILITAEAIRSLLAHGLEEPASATYRTLLELERDLRLVIDDPSDTRARRLALFLAVKGRRSFTKATKSPATLDLLKGDSDFFDWFRRKSRSFRHWIDSKDYRDVADELRQADHWHGLTQQEAFEKAGMTSAYNLEYVASSIFVHGSNVEHDFAEPGSTGIRFKPLVQRDPTRTFTQLGRATHSLVDIYRLIWEDRGKPQYQESFTVEVEGGERFEADALDALAVQAINIFPNPRSKSAP